MNGSGKARDFDCAILGGGMAGLFCALALARKGRSVCLLERNDVLGGLGSSFSRGPYTFDAAVDSISLIGPGEPIGKVLEDLDLHRAVRWLPLKVVREVVLNGERIRIGSGRSGFRSFLKERYPGERDHLDRFWSTIETLARDAARIPFHHLDSPSSWKRLFPLLATHLTTTYRELLQEHVHHEELLQLLAERSHFLGVGSDRLSSVSMAVLMASYYGGTVGRVEGGLQNLVRALERLIEAHGGVIRRGCTATSIIPVNEKSVVPQYVVLSGEEEVCCSRAIVGTFNAHLFWKLIDFGKRSDHPPARSCEDSCSFVLAYLAGRLGERKGIIGSSVGIWPGQGMNGGKLALGFGFTIPTLIDRTLAPPREDTAVLHIPVSPRLLDAGEKEGIIAEALDVIDPSYPGLFRDMRIITSAGPETLERYGAGRGGPAFGWLHTPDRLRQLADQERRLPRGCYLAGSWHTICAGIPSSAVSGYRTALRILREQRARVPVDI